MLLEGGLVTGVTELLPTGTIEGCPIDSSGESGGKKGAGGSSGVCIAALIVGVLVTIGGGSGVENAREERRGILKPGEGGFVGVLSSIDCCRVMGGAAPGGRGPWARRWATGWTE